MSDILQKYSLPYSDILYTEKQGMLESALHPICPRYRIYDESKLLTKSMVDRLRKILRDDSSHEIVLVRNLLRDDKAHLIPEIPEAWWWVFLWRLLWQFHWEPDPWFEIKWWAWLEMRGKRQALNMAGCQNSGKSIFGGTFPIIQLIVWDHMCRGYISGPFKEHAKDKIWDAMQTQLTILKSVGISIPAAFGFDIIENKNEITIETEKGQGLLKFVASQEASSVIGAKTKDHSDATGRRGISMFIVDEYVENANTDIARAFGNFRSNMNSIMFLMCNPNPTTALHPNVVSFIDPIGKKRSDMRKDRDYTWNTSKGRVIRFDWSNCPNKILDANRWPYLMNAKRAESQETESDDNRAGQLDAWPFGAEGANSLTDRQRQIEAGVFSPFYYENAPKMRIMALDPAFGGEDPAIYTILDVADVSVEGMSRTRFVGVEQNYVPDIDRDYTATADFVRKCEEIARHRESKGDRDTQYLRGVRIGENVGPMAQGAVEAAHLCLSKGVPLDCFTFDASQRADCLDWITKVFGRHNLAWWYEGSRRLIQEEGDDWVRWPYRTKTERNDTTRHEKWSDYCSRLITMIWAFACELINNGYVINGNAIQKSLDELGAREVASKDGGKVDVWSKEDIKRGTFQGKKIPKMKSPAWGETLAMALYFGARFKNAVEIGERPELSHHFGQTQEHWDDWLELHDGVRKRGFTLH